MSDHPKIEQRDCPNEKEIEKRAYSEGSKKSNPPPPKTSEKVNNNKS